MDSSTFDYTDIKRNPTLKSLMDEETCSVDSEESYDYLIKKSEFLEEFTHLSFDENWMGIAAFANIILFVIFTYKLAFNYIYFSYFQVKFIILVCNVILIIDITASVLHLVWKRYANLRNFQARNKTLIATDLLSILVMLVGSIPSLGKLIQMQVIELVFITFRLYRLVVFLIAQANTSGNSTNLIKMFSTQCMILFLVSHTYACIVKLMACYKCADNTNNWSTTINEKIFSSKNSPVEWYLVCMWLTLGQLTTLGAGELHPINNLEHILMIFVTLSGFIIIDGALVSAWTSVQMESYRKHSNFMNRLILIDKSLSHPRISKHLKNKIMNYYRTFWKQNRGIRYSVFFNVLPICFREQVNLDMYWNVFEQSYLLKSIHPSFKRAIASVMTTEIYMAGEYVFNDFANKTRMIYIFKGALQILSMEDGESSVLTLGIGTCLGEANLFFSTVSPVNVKAITYCVLQCLKKDDFWRVAFKCRRLHQLKNVRKLMEKKLENAKKSKNLSSMFGRSSNDTLPLKLVKYRLKPERLLSRNVIMKQLKKTQEEEDDPSSLYILSMTSDDAQADTQATIFTCNSNKLRALKKNLFFINPNLQQESYCKHQTTLKYSDETCLRTSFPWILHPGSNFLRYWEYLTCACIFLVITMYPYLFSFVRSFEPAIIIIIVLINGNYLLDVLFEVFTAIELERKMVTKMKELIIIRLKQPTFICDIVACLPLRLVILLYDLTADLRIISLLSINRMLKVTKLLLFVTKITSSFDVNIALVRCIKYVVTFFLLAYFIGALLYMTACFREVCSSDSWFSQIQMQDEVASGTRYKHPFPLSIYFGSLIISTTSYGDMTPWNIMEVCLGILFSLMGMFVFCYLVSDFSATLMLENRARLNFLEVVTVIKKYLASNNMLMNNQIRIAEYLDLQWRRDRGYDIRKEHSIFFDIPYQLFREQQSAKNLALLTKIPLFTGLTHELLKDVATNCKRIFLPPNEIVLYAGERVRDLYLLDRGYCEVISVSSGKLEKVLGPSSYFGDFDMLLEQPGVFNIRTLTHVRILKIPYVYIKRALYCENVHEKLAALAKTTKASFAVQRLFLRSATVNYHYMKSRDTYSWFIFPHHKLNLLSIDYNEGFEHSGIWRFLKNILMRRTILPSSSFLVYWEGVQTIRIITMSHYYVTLPIWGAYSIYVQYIWICFDIMSAIDIYIRMHICYYNNIGILVTHPRYTAKNYLTTSFTIDFLSLIPFPLLIGLIYKSQYHKTKNVNTIELIIRLHKLLQFYRVPKFFAHLGKDQKIRGIKLVFFKYYILSIVLFNSCATVLIYISCNIFITDDGYYKIMPKKESWLPHFQSTVNYDILNYPINMYITAYHFAVAVGLSAGNSSLRAQVISEFLLAILAIVSGYLLFTYIVIAIITQKASIDMNLSIYQEHMKHLIAYMKKECITRKLQKKVIDHFEYIWQRTHGMKSTKILNKCHLALRQDSVLYLYEETLLKIPVFEDMGKAFYRSLGLKLEEMYFLNKAIIIRLNDIIGNIYIVHKGEVSVLGPDGSIFASLTRGCMFGNIDQVIHSRSTVTVVASSKVDLLSISTDIFYNLAAEYPVLLSKIKNSIYLENSSYIKIKNQKEEILVQDNLGDDDIEDTIKQRNKWAQKIVKWFIAIETLQFPIMLSSYISFMFATYQLAFQDHSLLIFSLSYILDVFHLMKLITGFYIPYRNQWGDLITDPRKIRKRYLAPMQFYRELFSIIPFELLAIFMAKKYMMFYFTCFRINRLLRMWNTYCYFNVTFDRLNVNYVGIKSGSIFISFSLMLHLGACILYMAACPRGVCSKLSWIYYDELVLKNNHYLISLYFMLCITCHSGFGHTAPRTELEIVLCNNILIVSKLLIAGLIGEMSAVVQYYSFTLLKYDYQTTTLKVFLENSYVADALIRRIINYSEKLWTTDAGLQLPKLVDESPSYLLEEIKREAYGKHLLEHFLFASCHKDFLRLLIAKLKMRKFFKGDIVCQQGDINNTMFFIHKGYVNVYVVRNKEEVITDSLYERSCFGLIQGLIAYTPHTNTYKCGSSCAILKLELMDWAYLLRYYKAARSEIYTKLKNI